MYTAALIAALAAATTVEAAIPQALSSSTGVFAALRNLTNVASSSSTGSAVVLPAVTSAATTAATPVCNFNFAASSKDAIYAIANQQRLFQQHGLNVCFTAVTNVAEAYQGLLNGQYDVLSSQLDSTLDRYVNAGQNITVIGGLDGNPALALYSVSGVSTPQELVGKVIAVDQVNSGYEYIIEKILQFYGVQPGQYGFLPVGNTETRLSALQAGNYSGNTIHATLINSPYSEIETLALSSNSANRNTTTPLNKLATVTDFIPQYQGNVLTVYRPTLSNSTKAALLTNFTLVQLQARQILQIAPNQAIVIKSIAQEFNVTNTTAQAIYEAASSSDSGYLFNTNLQIFQDQLLTPTYLRQQFSGFSGSQDLSELLTQGSTGFIDYSIRGAALALLYSKNTYAAPLNASTTASTGVASAGIAANDTTATLKAYRTFY